MLMVPRAGSERSIVKRDALALLVEAQDYELAGPLLTRDAGRLNDKAFDIRSKECSVNNLEHV